MTGTGALDVAAKDARRFGVLDLAARAWRLGSRQPRTVRGAFKLVPYLILVLPPFVMPGQIDIWANPLLIGIAGAVGLNVLSGTAGLISLGQAGFLAVGAYSGVFIAITEGLSFPVALLASIVSGAVVGLVVGLSTSRLRGLYGVISTLALQYVVVYLGTEYQEAANNTAAFVLPSANLGSFAINSSDRWYAVLAVVAAAYVFLYRRLLRSHVGRALEVIGERDHVAGLLGINVIRYSLSAWMLSGASVALVGCIQAYYLNAVSPDAFTLAIAIQYFAMIVIGGRGSPMGSVIGAVIILTLPFELQGLITRIGGTGALAQVSDYDTIIYGLLLIGFLVLAPEGVAGWLQSLANLIRRKAAGQPEQFVAAKVAAPRDTEELRPAVLTVAPGRELAGQPVTGKPESSPAQSESALLEVRHLTVGYRGGSIALRDVSLHVRSGEVVAILGPNGAGKTTLLRAIAGFVVDEPGFVREGSVRFEGQSVDHVAAFRRANTGIVLVPEREKVFPSMSVAENLELASPGRKQTRALIEEVMEYFPALRRRMNVPAVLLSGGERQMLAIGRGFMLAPRLLLLDETTLGLAPILAREVMDHIGRIARGSKTSVLLVEQNAALAETVADRHYTLQNGQVVEQGKLGAESSRRDLVRSYFGQAPE